MAIKDRLIQFVLRGKDELSPEVKKAAAALESLEQEAASLGAALDSAKSAQGMVRDLAALERAAAAAQGDIRDAEHAADSLRSALSRDPGNAALEGSLKRAEREAGRARREYNKLDAQLKAQRASARAAGIDTGNLSAEQARLAAATASAKTAVQSHAEAVKQARRELAAANRAAAENAATMDRVRGGMASAGKAVLGMAAAYVSLQAVTRLLSRGLDAVVSGIGSVIAAGSDSQSSLAQLEATLASTGRAGEFSAAALSRMAAQLQKSSMLSAEQVMDAQTRLLSYTDVAATEFPRALKLVIDQQQRLGISIEQSAEIVGRALQSPADAITTLGRQGFKFTAEQKDMLKQMQATGRMAEAQAVIMDMLAESYGGAANAARLNTFQGLLKGIADQLGAFATKVSESGAFAWLQDQFRQLDTWISRMASSGKLDELASSLSSAFIQAGEAAKDFFQQLVGNRDFEQLASDSAAYFSDFGARIEAARASVAAFAMPFRVLFNGITSGVAAIGLALSEMTSAMLKPAELLASAWPEALGGKALRDGIANAKGMLGELSSAFSAQIQQDAQDMAAAIDAAAQRSAESGKQVAEGYTAAARAAATAAQAAQTWSDDLHAGMAQLFEDLDSGRKTIDNLGSAMQYIAGASTVEQFDTLRKALLAAFQAGTLSQQEFAAASAELGTKVRALKPAVAEVADAFDAALESAKGFADIGKLIEQAGTDRQLDQIRARIRELYDAGTISSAQYAKALDATTARHYGLKEAAQQAAAGTQALADAQNEAAAAATAQAEAEAQRRSALSGFFGAALSEARGAVAALSQAALQLYDQLRGVSTARVEIDTSSLEATRRSISGVASELARVRAELDGNVMISSLGRWAMETRRSSLQIQQDYLGQKATMQRLQAAYDDGRMSAARFAAAARGAASSLTLLDSSDLSGLRSAAKSAEQSMLALQGSTRSTMESLMDELDALEGREADAERRRFAARRRDLQAQLAEAQASGDSQAIGNAGRALSLLRQVEAATEQQRARDQQQKLIEQQQQMLEKQQPTGAAPEQPTQIIRLEAAGRTVDVGVSSSADATALLGILETAGLRSL